MWPAVLSQGDRSRLLLLLGVAGVVVLLLGCLVGHPVSVTVAVALLGGAYALHLILDRPALDARAALVATGLLLVAELGNWSIELRREVSREPGRQTRRLAAELMLCVGGLLVSALVLAAADLARTGGIAIELAGAAAAVAIVWMAVIGLRPQDSATS